MKVAIVTGGARGIGRACAERLAADGHRVVIADRQGADAAAADIPGAVARTVDLSDAAQTGALANWVLEQQGRCDVLVNNAAQMGIHTLEELTLEIWRRFQAVSVEAPFLLCARLIPAMVAAGGGRVVNIVSDTLWSPPGAGLVAYITMKGALLGMTRSLATEYGGRNVTVNAVAPGLTPTPGSTADTPSAVFKAVLERQAINRAMSPEDVAGAVGYLTSEAASAITGQTLCVDGGLVMM